MKYSLLLAALCLSLASFGQQYAWQAQSLPATAPSNEDLLEVVTLSPEAAVAIGTRQIYKTSDGGQAWDAVAMIPFGGTCITFPDAKHGWAGGKGGVIYSSANGGNSWRSQTTNTNWDILDIHFVDSLYGWALTKEARIIRTVNGGQTWFGVLPTVVAGSIHFVNRNLGYADAKLRTTDGGATWNEYGQFPENPVHNRFGKIFYLDARHGWATAQNTVGRTANGGLNWARHYTGTDSNSIYGEVLGHVHFTDTLNGWAAGRAGLIRTTDGGITWNRFQSTIQEMASVHLLDRSHGWAVGGTQIFKLVDSALVSNSKPVAPAGNSVRLYPNPSQGFFTLEMTTAAQVDVHNLIGARIARLGKRNAGRHSIDLNPFGKGIYIFRIKTVTGIQALKATLE